MAARRWPAGSIAIGARSAPRPAMPPLRPRTTSRAAWPRRSMARSSGRPTGSSSVSRPRREPIPVDRALLATLPGQPPADVPLVCLDTETTGLATAAGTLAWLIGLGWWEARPLPPGPAPAAGQRRGALPARRARGDDPRRGWLVTYNGRGFDWPLLVAALPARATGRPGPRRSSRPAARRPAPVPSSHGRRPASDRRSGAPRAPSRRRRRGLGDPRALPRVPPRRAGRAAGRHRPPQRPGRPLAGSPADADRERIRDPRGPADGADRGPGRTGDRVRARGAPRRGPGLLRRRHRRPRRTAAPPTVRFEPPRATGASGELPWWSPRVAADFGGPRPAPIEAGRPIRSSTFASSWTPDRIAFERAHLLRRLKRWDEAVDAWTSLAAGPGRNAIVAAIELAKIREHRLRDPLGALHVAADALDMVERRRRRGRPEPRLEADLLARSRRLRRRLAARDGRPPAADRGHAGIACARRRCNPESRRIRCVDRTLHRATFPRPRGNRPRGGPVKGGGTVERRGWWDPD